MGKKKEMDMTAVTRFFVLSVIIVLVLAACNIGGGTPTVNGNPPVQPTATSIPGLTMNVTHQRANQTIEFIYLVGNTSGAPIPGPVTVVDDKVIPVTCPDLTLVGNLDANLDANEALSCSGTYTITQLDLDTGSLTTIATASASGRVSPTVTTSVPIEQARALTLSKTPDPLTYNSVGQTIIYSYVITNNGTVSLGPVQFTITDDKIGAAFNCGSGGTILSPGGTVSCSATYLTSQADLTAGSVINTAFASDGTTNSNPVTATINRSGTNGGTNPSDLPPGTTIQHTVVSGEWLWQIARCYGANPKAVVQSNSQLLNPAKILPGITVTVPNIGSDGAIFGPQQGNDPFLSCVPRYTIQSGDTWDSIANRFTASVTLLQSINSGIALLPGNIIRIPINSVGD
jgi:LysM repeat protein